MYVFFVLFLNDDDTTQTQRKHSTKLGKNRKSFVETRKGRSCWLETTEKGRNNQMNWKKGICRKMIPRDTTQANQKNEKGTSKEAK